MACGRVEVVGLCHTEVELPKTVLVRLLLVWKRRLRHGLLSLLVKATIRERGHWRSPRCRWCIVKMCVEGETSLVVGRLSRVEIVKIRHFGFNFIISIVSILLMVIQVLSVVFSIHFGQTIRLGMIACLLLLVVTRRRRSFLVDSRRTHWNTW